jgi:hypothetical protein
MSKGAGPRTAHFSYQQTLSSLKPRQTPQGITLQLLIEDMQMVLGCLVSRYPLLIGRDGPQSCFQRFFSGS